MLPDWCSHSSIVFNEPIFFFYRYQTHTCFAKFIFYEVKSLMKEEEEEAIDRFLDNINSWFPSFLYAGAYIYMSNREREKENLVNFVCHRYDVWRCLTVGRLGQLTRAILIYSVFLTLVLFLFQKKKKKRFRRKSCRIYSR